MFLMRELILGSLLVLSIATHAPAQQRRIPIGKLAVDMVTLKSGPRLLGVILHRNPDNSVLFAVDRTWLKQKYPQLEQAQREQEAKQRIKGLETVLNRIDEWKRTVADNPPLLKFLTSERERIQERLLSLQKAQPDKLPRFTLLEISINEIQTAYAQPENHRQIALVAIAEELPDLETSQASQLYRALTEKKVQVVDRQVDLAKFLPERTHEETENQWAARRALVGYRFEKALNLQGTGNLLFKTGADAPPPDLKQLTQGLLQENVGDLLSELLEPNAIGKKQPGENWQAKAIAMAKAEAVSGCRVTRLQQDLTRKQVTVSVHFLARMPDDSWQVIWTGSHTESALKPHPELEAEIKKNNEVNQILGLAKTLGLGDDPVDLAIKFGAATMAAQTAADKLFYDFWDKAHQKLDGAALEW